MTESEGIRAVAHARAVDESLVTAHSSAPGRTVLTECGNANAWIASDLAVELPR